jgi:hypothetical protein
MKPLSTEQVNHILLLLDLGHSGHSIHHQTGISVSKVSQLRKEHRPHLQKSTGGCPKILSDMDLRHSTRLLTSGQVDNAPQLARRLQEIKGRPISAQTVRRGLKSVGMKAVVKVKKPLLKAHHKRARKEFAERYLHWTVEDWKRVIWSDETKINRIGSDGRSWGWKRRGERLSDRLVTPTLKFGGGSLMLWGCMSWEGVGHACKIEGRMDANCYVDILEDELQKSIDYFEKDPEEVIFQQDNDPKHTSKKAKEWFQNHGMEVLEWPAQSPDLNPIEHLWKHLKQRLCAYENPPQGINELWERVQREWELIDAGVCQNLIEAIPRRVLEVYQANGGYIEH